LVWQLWVVSPRTVREFLVSAGPKDAKSMTDKALLDFMVIMAVAHKMGIDLDEAERHRQRDGPGVRLRKPKGKRK